jgi:general secretion pathway protein G
MPLHFRHYQKKAMSLLEILIVIFIIGLISSVVAFNLRGTLDKGKAFKTKQLMQQLEEVLTLEMMQNPKATPKQIQENPKKFLVGSPLIKNPDDALKDGWNKPFSIRVQRDGTVKITSSALNAYENRSQ